MAARGRVLFFLYIYKDDLKISSSQKPLDRFECNMTGKYPL